MTHSYLVSNTLHLAKAQNGPAKQLEFNGSSPIPTNAADFGKDFHGLPGDLAAQGHHGLGR